SNVLLQARATGAGSAESPITSANFKIIPITAAPTISPAGGTFNSTVTVTLADSTANASIYYTTDGSTPTTASSLYVGPFTLVASATVSAISIAPGYIKSSVTTASISVVLPVATPVIAPNGGSFSGLVTVSMVDGTLGAA